MKPEDIQAIRERVHHNRMLHEDDAHTLLTEIERLRGVLEWYADSTHYFRHPISKDSDVEWDNGERARQALDGDNV